MNRMHFAIEDVKRNKWYYLRFFIQIICVILLAGACISTLHRTSSFIGKFKSFENREEFYLIRDNSQTSMPWGSEEDAHRLLEMYRFLTDDQSNSFAAYYERALPIPENKSYNIATDKGYEQRDGLYTVMFVNKSFVDVFKLSASRGRSFSEEEYENKTAIMPAIGGNKYAANYSVGDTVGGYRLIGFLEKRAFYLAPGKIGEILYLDDCLIVPAVVDENTDYGELDNLITGGLLHTTDKSAPERLSKKAAELDAYEKLEAEKLNDQLDWIINDTKATVWLLIAMQIVILIFCMGCTVAALINYIEKHRREFAMHLLCGAGEKDLVIRLSIPIAGVLLIANLIADIAFRDAVVALVLFLFSAIILIGVMLLPTIRIKQKRLAGFLKEE